MCSGTMLECIRSCSGGLDICGVGCLGERKDMKFRSQGRCSIHDWRVIVGHEK